MSRLDIVATRILELAPLALEPAVCEDAKLALAHNLLVGWAARALLIPGEWATAGRPHADAQCVQRLRDGRYVPAHEGIVSNSLMMGARAQHDEHPRSVSHFGSVVIPALLGAAEIGMFAGEAKHQGARFLQSMILGYQTGAALARPARPLTTNRGFRPTGLFGPFASAAAVAFASGANMIQMRNALACALSTSAGITQVWRDGSDEWRFQTAYAARSGFDAAYFALHGGSGAQRGLEGTSGFFRAFAGVSGTESDEAAAVVSESISRPWAISELLLKPYPVCAINQAAVVQVLELIHTHNIEWERVSCVEVSVSPSDAAYPGINTHELPTTWTQAIMSMPHAMATSLLHRTIDYTHLSPPFSPGIADLITRITVVADASIGDGHGAIVRVHTIDGRVYGTEHVGTVARGWEEVDALAGRLVPDLRLPPALVKTLIESIRQIDDDDGFERFHRNVERIARHGVTDASMTEQE